MLLHTLYFSLAIAKENSESTLLSLSLKDKWNKPMLPIVTSAQRPSFTRRGL